MPFPTVRDDGSSVTLDLHGATIEEAIQLTRRTLDEASRRGRSHVKVIHGTSSSSRLYRNRTIKHELHDLLDRGALRPMVQSTVREDGYLLLGLEISSNHDARRIEIRDVMR